MWLFLHTETQSLHMQKCLSWRETFRIRIDMVFSYARINRDAEQARNVTLRARTPSAACSARSARAEAGVSPHRRRLSHRWKGLPLELHLRPRYHRQTYVRRPRRRSAPSSHPPRCFMLCFMCVCVCVSCDVLMFTDAFCCYVFGACFFVQSMFAVSVIALLFSLHVN